MPLDKTQATLETERTPATIRDKDKILTLNEVAAMLRLHKSTVSRHAKAGTLVSYKIGARRLIKESDAWEFFENHIAQ